MPMCHANSLNFFGAFTYCGAADDRLLAQELRSRALRADAGRRRLELHLAGADPLHHDAAACPRRCASASDFGRVTKLMISSAPARAGHQAGGDGDVPQFRPVRALRLERGGLGDHAAAARAVHQAGLGRPRSASARRRSAARRGRQRGPGRRGRRALLLQPLHLRRLLEAAGEDARRRSAATIARSATWPGATRTATSTSSTARAT